MSLPKRIIVEEYSTCWETNFNELKSVYETYLGNLISAVEHVGSTSVADLAAKPILDIDLIIENNDCLNPVIKELEKLGYEFVGDLDVPDRWAFKRNSDKTPLSESGKIWQKHHLYVCPKDSLALQDHLQLRNYLRAHPDKVIEYGELKKSLAVQFTYDIDNYIWGKTPFIVSVLREVGFDEKELEKIIELNKPKTLKNNKY